MKFPSREELAWIAGIHCGEGSISLHKPRRFVGIRFTVGQSSSNEDVPEMLIRLKNILGTGSIYSSNWSKNKPTYKKQFQFVVRKFEEVQAIIGFIWEWLTPEKKEQAIKALSEFHNYRKLNQTKNYAV